MTTCADPDVPPAARPLFLPGIDSLPVVLRRPRSAGIGWIDDEEVST